MFAIHAVTLDLDDTLWAIGPVIRRAEAELWAWLSEHYPVVTDTFSRERAVKLRDDVVAAYPEQRHDLRFLRKQVLGRMAQASGYDDSLVEQAFAVFDRARNSVDLYPDVLPALGEIAARHRLVALTNGNANLQTIGIGHLFHANVAAGEVGVAKPDQRIFQEAVKRGDADAQHILHVGDDPEIDVAGAARAGLRTAWMNRDNRAWPKHLPPPDVIVTDMLELHAWLLADGSN